MVQSFIIYLRDIRGYSLKTQKSYSDVLRVLTNTVHSLRGCELHELDLNGCKSLLNYVAVHRELSARSRNLYLSVLKSYFDYLCRFGYVAVNAPAPIPNCRVAKLLPRYINESIMNQVIGNELPDSTFTECRTRLIVLTLYHCGLRASELLNLEINKIDVRLHSMRVIGKGNKERILPFGDELAECIIKYLILRNRKKINSPYLFTEDSGTQLQGSTLREIIRQVFSKHCDNSLCHPHVLRHTFATTLLANGCSLNVIQFLMGHASLATTEIYTHVTTKAIVNQYNKAFKR